MQAKNRYAKICNPKSLLIVAALCNYAYGEEPPVEEVLVTGKQLQLNFEPSVQTQKLLDTAGSLGDPIQAVFSLPGVVQVDEEDAAPAVRGSSPNANGFLVDGMRVNNLFHLFGNSVFNENLIQDFGLEAAGFGAQYGSATGAIFDVSLRDPRNQPLETTIDLSFLMASILTEGAVTDTQSFYLAYRESLMSLWVLGENLEEDFNVPDLPSFNDYQGKYLWQYGGETSLVFSINGIKDEIAAIFGENNEDVLLDPGLEGDISLSSESHSQSITWRSPSVLLMAGHSRENSKDKIGNGEYLNLVEEVSTLKGSKQISLGDHIVSLGIEAEHAEYDYDFNLRFENCSDFTASCATDYDEAIIQDRVQRLNIFDAYIQDEYTLSERASLEYGLHLTKDDYLKELHIDPRLHFSWSHNKQWSLHSSIGRYHQLPDLEQIFPVIGNPNLTSLNATHYVVGLNHAFDNNSAWLDSSWSLSLEAYYKDIKDLVVNVEDIDLQYLNKGEGKAYGLELMINKELTERWYGWLNIALAKTVRTNLLTGQSTPFSYDAPAVVNLVTKYQMSKNWSVGARWTYRSGTLYTPIIGNEPNPHYEDAFIPVYGKLNSKRINPFHRLDIRFERPFDSFVRGEFFVDILNAYSRENTSGIDYIAIKDSEEYKLEKREGYGFFPSIGVKVIF